MSIFGSSWNDDIDDIDKRIGPMSSWLEHEEEPDGLTPTVEQRIIARLQAEFKKRAK